MTKQSRTEAINMDYRLRILDAAMGLARKIGYQRITRDAVALSAGVGIGTVNKYFGTIAELRSCVLHHAVQIEDLAVVAQGVAVGAAELAGITPELKTRALASV